MLASLYDYFFQLIYAYSYNGTPFPYLDDTQFNIGDYYWTFGEWLAGTFAIISFILIVFLCCLFIWKLIKVVGRLFMGA